ncbi:MAG: hypothetical protein JSS10_02025 [Verrucomicrobia bacterium]|nr:hypothetical protein [Verrucomicrobiota bacterium]
MSIEQPSGYWPTQWPQVLVGKHITVNNSTYGYPGVKLFLQGSLSTATAAAGVIATASEGVNLVIDRFSYALSFPIKYVTDYKAPDSFYQTLSSRPTLSYRVERIVSQALGAVASSLQTCFLFAMRDDWSTQLHQHLGNYKPPAQQPPLKSAALPAPEASKGAAESSSTATPSASAPAAAAKAAPPPPPLPPSLPADSKTATLTSSALSSTGGGLSGADAGPALEGAAKPPGKKKKRVVIVSRPPTNTSPLEEIKAQAGQKAAKGEEIAAKLAEEEAAKANAKIEREEEKHLKQAFAKIRARRVESVHFTGYDDKHGNLASGKMSLRVLIRAFSLPFPKDFIGTLGEYVLEEFEKQSLPIEPSATCEILDEDWGTAVRLTITKMAQDPTTGKNTILEVGLLWQDVSVK